MKIELAKTEIIHFVGIGGSGMSGIAEVLLNHIKKCLLKLLALQAFFYFRCAVLILILHFQNLLAQTHRLL